MQNIISNFDSISEEIMSKYAGEWVAVIDGRVIAHNKSLRAVYEYAKANFPGEKPLIGKIPIDSIIVLSIF